VVGDDEGGWKVVVVVSVAREVCNYASRKKTNHKIPTISPPHSLRSSENMCKQSSRNGTPPPSNANAIAVSPPLLSPSRPPHIIVHFLLSFPPFGFTLNATLAASVNASFTPLFLIAEHSKYLSALILLATSNP